MTAIDKDRSVLSAESESGSDSFVPDPRASSGSALNCKDSIKGRLALQVKNRRKNSSATRLGYILQCKKTVGERAPNADMTWIGSSSLECLQVVGFPYLPITSLIVGIFPTTILRAGSGGPEYCSELGVLSEPGLKSSGLSRTGKISFWPGAKASQPTQYPLGCGFLLHQHSYLTFHGL